MAVDDRWATIGSCNLHRYSREGHSELNASIWDAAVARDLRERLFAAHLGMDTSPLDDLAAFGHFRRIAQLNRRKMCEGSLDWQGTTFALDPQSYAVT